VILARRKYEQVFISTSYFLGVSRDIVVVTDVTCLIFYNYSCR
jgi:hypothetical protein